MVRDNSHAEQVERWARFVRENPNSWKREHTLFINSQLNMALDFFKRLGKTGEGRRILDRLLREKISK